MSNRGLQGALRCSLLLFAGTLVPARPLSAGTDFLVVERVDRLNILNKYQQEVTSGDRAVLVPFVPMKILKERDLLSDGYTRCMQVDIGGEMFYLLQDQNSRLTFSSDPGVQQIFRGVTAVHDTVEVRRDHALFLSPVTSGRQHPLQAGDRLVRIFLRRNEAYCGVPGGSPAYGWVDLGGTKEGRDWKPYTGSTPVEGRVIPAGVVEKIRLRVDAVNEAFRKLFGHFNAETRLQNPPPRWTLEVTEKSVRCLLQSDDPPDHFQQSTFYLAKDIENYTLGSELLVAQSPGRIEVMTRGGH